MSAPDFDRMYIDEGDPWKVGSSWYERRKIAVVMASLSDQRYRSALDPACGTAHLAAQLATRCEQVTARDGSAAAIEVARQTCAGIGNVAFEVRSLPAESIEHHDLIVLSEFLYYLDAPTRAQVVTDAVQSLGGRGELVAVHWRERPEDGETSGDEVHAELRELAKSAGLRHQVAHFDEEFALDIFTRGHDQHIS